MYKKKKEEKKKKRGSGTRVKSSFGSSCTGQLVLKISSRSSFALYSFSLYKGKKNTQKKNTMLALFPYCEVKNNQTAPILNRKPVVKQKDSQMHLQRHLWNQKSEQQHSAKEVNCDHKDLKNKSAHLNELVSLPLVVLRKD